MRVRNTEGYRAAMRELLVKRDERKRKKYERQALLEEMESAEVVDIEIEKVTEELTLKAGKI